MALSNVMDRDFKLRMDPDAIKIMPTKAIIRRKFLSEKKGSLIIPGSSKASRATFQGWIHSIGDDRPLEHLYEDLAVGDEVVFSYQVDGQDSTFFEHEGEQFALVPIEAIQLRIKKVGWGDEEHNSGYEAHR